MSQHATGISGGSSFNGAAARGDSMRKAKSRDERCERCGHSNCDGTDLLDIPIEKGHVRRAIRAADAVYASAAKVGGAAHEVESGVVLMTAVLLVERMAAAHNSAPGAVLNLIASCFDLKQRHMVTLKHSN